MTDTEIRAYLAERWSRSQPKEAALDYMANGVWEERRENVREDRSPSPGEAQGEAGGIHAAANDNALARIARDVRRTAFGWRHAQAVGSFVDGRRQVLAAYDDLRERTRIEGDAVALSGAYRETLTRHAVLLKQAESFRARPGEFASLLAERGGIGRKDLDAFKELHTRVRRHRRAATMRYVHRVKQEAAQQGVDPDMRQGEAAAITPAGHIQSIGLRDDSAQSRAHPATPNTPPVAAPVRKAEPVKPYWYAPYMALRQDWNAFIEGARQAGIMTFYAKGYADMIPRIQALAENPDVPAVTRAPMMQVLENHQRYLSTRKHIEDYLDQVDRHIEEHDSMESLAEELDMKVAEISDYPDWRRENDRLTTAGEAILSDMETHGPHLDNILIGEGTHEMGALEHEPRHPPGRRGHQRGSSSRPKSCLPSRKRPRSGSSWPNGRLSNSAGFSRLWTMQPLRRSARRRKRNSTTMWSATPIRPAKRSTRAAQYPGAGASACNRSPIGRIRALSPIRQCAPDSGTARYLGARSTRRTSAEHGRG